MPLRFAALHAEAVALVERQGRVRVLRVHVAVHDLRQSIRFYSALFGAQPSVEKEDYAKRMLEDPRVNFAISTRGNEPGG